MSNQQAKPNRMQVWGHSMLNKLPGISRKRRKREASKKRREIAREDLQHRIGDSAR